MESPKPVPEPTGLVVKKGLNIWDNVASSIPKPLSIIEILTALLSATGDWVIGNKNFSSADLSQPTSLLISQ